jgi:hypothetical protein
MRIFKRLNLRRIRIRFQCSNSSGVWVYEFADYKNKTGLTDQIVPTKIGTVTFLVIILLSIIVTGCGTLENGRGWGRDAIYPVDFDRICRAAHDAFFDWQTLVPLGGGLFFALDDFDERVSDWASDHNPIFGSRRNARNASDNLRTTLWMESAVTALATPSGDEPTEWTFSKLKGLGVEYVAIRATSGVTGWLKNDINRQRPDKSNDYSFPSGHSSSSFSYMTLANRNLDSIDLPEPVIPVLKTGNLLLATSVAWARVEGRKHYPSDVLVGAALGHFLTAFIHDAFLNLPEDNRVQLAI